MAFKISELSATINKNNGLYRNAHFMVNIFSPFTADTRDLSFLCMSANLPGLHFDTISIRPMGMGNSEQRPHDSNYAPVRCDLLLDNKNYVLGILHNWMGNIQNFSNDVTKASDNTKLNYYQLAYPIEYEGTVEIITYAGDGSDLIKYTLYGAYPGNIADLAVDWNAHDEVARLSVTFNYKSWGTSLLPFNTNAPQTGQNVSALRNLYDATIQNNPRTVPLLSNSGGLGPDGSVGPIPLRDSIPSFTPRA